MTVDVRCTDGRIEIEPGYLPVRLEQRGPLLVAVPLEHVEPLTHEQQSIITSESALALYGIGCVRRG